MSEEDIEDKIIEQFEECANILLSCENENKKCKKCKGKEDCLIFIRSVLAAVCMKESIRSENGKKKIPEGLYT